MSLTVKHWKRFQHYKTRRPAWIKLHRDILDDFEFSCLPLASQAVAPRLWLLASESDDGSIPSDPSKLAFRFRCSVAECIEAVNPLILAGFLEGSLDASAALAPCKQSAIPEIEKRREEREIEREAIREAAPPLALATRAAGHSPANPLLGDRPAREREALRLVTRLAEINGTDPAEEFADAAHYKGAERRKVNPAAMSDDRLLNTLMDLRANVKTAEARIESKRIEAAKRERAERIQA